MSGDSTRHGAQRVAVPALGGVELWVVEVPPTDPDALASTFAALDAEHVPGAPGPIGLGVLIGDRELRRDRPEAVWEDPRLVYAGYADDDRQLRIAYFAGARLGQGPRTPPPAEAGSAAGLRIGRPAELGVEADAIVGLWMAEAGLAAAEAQRRLDEVLVVAVGGEGALLGVCTAYLERSPGLGMDLWMLRTFVAATARGAAIAAQLAVAGRDTLRERFTSGADTRAAGMLVEAQHEGMRRRLDQAVWPRTQAAYIGLSAAGFPVRVYYFPGARAPEPPPATPGP